MKSLSIHGGTSGEIESAKELLERRGAEDISATRESSSGTVRSD
jgi:hypothetical protein